MDSLVIHSRQRKLQCRYTMICIVDLYITSISSTLLFWMSHLLQWCTVLVSQFFSQLLLSHISSITQWKDSWPLTSCNSHPLSMTRWLKTLLVSLNGLQFSTLSSDIGSWVTSKCSKTFTNTFPPPTLSCLQLIPSKILPSIKLYH